MRRRRAVRGQAAHHLLVGGRCAEKGERRTWLKEPARSVPTCGEADDIEQVQEATHATKPVNFLLPIFTTAWKREIVAIDPLSL